MRAAGQSPDTYGQPRETRMAAPVCFSRWLTPSPLLGLILPVESSPAGIPVAWTNELRVPIDLRDALLKCLSVFGHVFQFGHCVEVVRYFHLPPHR
jgi:hypothetical protein